MLTGKNSRLMISMIACARSAMMSRFPEVYHSAAPGDRRLHGGGLPLVFSNRTAAQPATGLDWPDVRLQRAQLLRPNYHVDRRAAGHAGVQPIGHSNGFSLFGLYLQLRSSHDPGRPARRPAGPAPGADLRGPHGRAIHDADGGCRHTSPRHGARPAAGPHFDPARLGGCFSADLYCMRPDVRHLDSAGAAGAGTGLHYRRLIAWRRAFTAGVLMAHPAIRLANLVLHRRGSYRRARSGVVRLCQRSSWRRLTGQTGRRRAEPDAMAPAPCESHSHAAYIRVLYSRLFRLHILLLDLLLFRPGPPDGLQPEREIHDDFVFIDGCNDADRRLDFRPGHSRFRRFGRPPAGAARGHGPVRRGAVYRHESVAPWPRPHSHVAVDRL